jgi:hypothetical protein
MAVIAKYEFESQTLDRKLALPLNEYEWLHDALDAITAACEEGVLDSEKWVSQCFANADVYEQFINDVAEYDECFRIRDRWYAALMALADVCDEEEFIATRDIALKLREQVSETGQI